MQNDLITCLWEGDGQNKDIKEGRQIHMRGVIYMFVCACVGGSVCASAVNLLTNTGELNGNHCVTEICM
jgi:hypothetical protein